MFATVFKNKRNLLFVNRIVVCLLLIITASCQASTPPPDVDPPGGSTTIGIGINIARRYIDGNNNGVIDMPNTASYVQDPLHVMLNASGIARSYPSKWPYGSVDDAGFGSTVGPWRWTFSAREDGAVPQGLAALPIPTPTIEGFTATNDGQKIVTYSSEPILTIDLFEGKWSIELARTDSLGNAIFWKTRDVTIEDILIVQLGDSYSAGEGAPDRDSQSGYWGDDGIGCNGNHPEAHRSSYTWGSVAALQIQQFGALRDESVTYINLAYSGALIADLEGQLIQLDALKRVRKVDVVFISIGGNDAGFSNGIAAYLAREPVDGPFPDLGPSLEDIKDAINSGHWTGGKFTDVGSVLLEVFDSDIFTDHDWSNRLGLNGLDAGYENVARALMAHHIDPANVYILEYPDPFVANSGNPDEVCPGPVLTSVSSPLGRRMEIGRQEQQHAREHLVMPLNNRISAAALKAGWNVIRGEDAFYSHAICQDDRMVVRYEESYDLQGNRRGTLHPNAKGYEALGKLAFSAWLDGLTSDPAPTPVPTLRQCSAGQICDEFDEDGNCIRCISPTQNTP